MGRRHADAGASRFNISSWALDHPALTRYLLVVLLLLGAAAYFQLGQDEDPPFTFRAMVVRAYWPGATAQQMAEQVTDKLEKTLQEVPYADKIRSYSKPGEALIIFQVSDSSPPKEMPQIWYTVRKKIGDMRAHAAGRRGRPVSSTTSSATSTARSTRCRPTASATEELKDQADRVRQRLLKVQDVNKVDDLRRAGREDLHRDLAAAPGAARPRLQPGAGAARPAERGRIGRRVTAPTDYLQVRVGGQFNSVDELRSSRSAPNGASLQARRHRRDPARPTSIRRRSRCATRATR